MKKEIFTILISLFLILNVSAQEKYSKVRIFFNGKSIQQLAATGIAIEEGTLKRSVYFESDLSASSIQQIEAAGFEYEIQIDDVSKYYAERAADNAPLLRNVNDEWPVPVNWEYGSMGGFYNLTEVMAELDSMVALYPNLISARQPISTDTLTWEGRMLYWVRLSDNPNIDEDEPEVLYTSLHHAREPMSVQQNIWYMWHLLENYDTDPEIQQLVDATEMYFVPVINPDGFWHNWIEDPQGGGMWRKNKRDNGDGSFGVDPNRNYGYQWGYDDVGSSPDTWDETYRGPEAFSEPEVKNMRDFCNAHEFKIAMNYHSYSNLLLYAWGWTEEPSDDDELMREYSILMTKENNYTYGAGSLAIYPTNGGSDDWMYGEQTNKDVIYSYTPEVGNNSDNFWPPMSRIIPLCQEQMWQNIHAARLVGSYATTMDKSPLVLGDQSGYLSFEIRRLGLVDTESFTVSITPLDAYITEVGDAVEFSNMELLQTEMDSISFVLDAGIENGTTFSYLLSVDNGDFMVSDTIEKVFGTEVVIFADNCEDLSKWSTNDWALTQSNFHSPIFSITDSPSGNYQDEETYRITLDTVVDLTDATMAFLRFWASWDIESGWDYLQVDAKANDNGSWLPLSGLYTKPGSGQFQPTGEPVYDGISDWVLEEMNISDFIGKEVQIRFTLYTDQAVNEDGYYFDDVSFSVISNTVGIGEQNDSFRHSMFVSDAYPNPAKQEFKLSYQLNNNQQPTRLELFDALGHVVRIIEINKPSGILTIQMADLRDGVYFYRLVSDQNVSDTHRLIKQ